MENVERKPLLSVIIPIYNVEPYLSRCLESVLNQSYDNLEVICVNDGSTDNSDSIANQYALNDSRVKVISKENGGLVSARKAGIEQASGKYATYVDSDDWIEQGMYETLMELIIRYNADLVTSGIIRDYGSHTIIEGESVPPCYYDKNTLIEIRKRLINTECFFERGISVAVWNKIYRSDLLKECQREVDNQISIGEDVAVVYPYIFNIESVVISGKNYYHYCIRENSVMGKKKSNETESVNLMLNYIESKFQSRYSFVSNLEMQFEFLYTYFKLLRETELIINYSNEILYPFGQIAPDSSIIIYGKGRFGKELLKLLETKNEFKVVGLGDKKEGKDTLSLDEISCLQYDKIIIAILIADIADEVEKSLLAKGIPQNKIMRIDAQLIKKTASIMENSDV